MVKKFSLGFVCIVLFGTFIVGSLLIESLSGIINVSVTGEPLDSAGETVGCPHCGHAWTHQIGGYTYRCEDCGRKFDAKFDSSARIYFTPLQ